MDRNKYLKNIIKIQNTGIANILMMFLKKGKHQVTT